MRQFHFALLDWEQVGRPLDCRVGGPSSLSAAVGVAINYSINAARS